MAEYIAFLRGINVAGHIVKMDVLREQFAVAGLSKAETLIASGNVIFQSRSADTGEVDGLRQMLTSFTSRVARFSGYA